MAMKIYIKLDLDTEEDKELYKDINRVAEYSRFYRDLYDTVFRPILKYGQDEKQAAHYEEVWEKILQFQDDLK
jgi:hypothetical protein